ncbi:hypothetical protein LSH36_44g00005 [Paralvinella palmiformis]|uniref:Uncharacterized protein n=1 Tax=Paralvinella palmiformis TaxID=53620 RepID=A0AAD9K8B6_9ANNE|nr:hypothetical protein LSH36_44g00005 [Paralvinella palmiformis]
MAAHLLTIRNILLHVLKAHLKWSVTGMLLEHPMNTLVTQPANVLNINKFIASIIFYHMVVSTGKGSSVQASSGAQRLDLCTINSSWSACVSYCKAECFSIYFYQADYLLQ